MYNCEMFKGSRSPAKVFGCRISSHRSVLIASIPEMIRFQNVMAELDTIAIPEIKKIGNLGFGFELNSTERVCLVWICNQMGIVLHRVRGVSVRIFS